jgi:hypothetical protein
MLASTFADSVIILPLEFLVKLLCYEYFITNQV